MESPKVAIRIDQAESQKVAIEFCALGDRNCKRFTKLGMCKTPECPIVAKERRMAAKAAKPRSLVDLQCDYLDVDLPFSLAELESVTSPLYVECLSQSGLPNPHRIFSRPASRAAEDDPAT